MIIIVTISLFGKFFTHWWFLTEVEWQQVSSNLQDSSQYSDWSQYCCSLKGLYLSSNFYVFSSLYQSFRDCSKSTNYYYYYYHYKIEIVTTYNYLQIININRWNQITVCKLFALKIVTWSNNYLEMIIIISYLRLYNCMQKKRKGKIAIKQTNKGWHIKPTNNL